MRKDSSRTILALILASLMAPPLLAAQQGKLTGAVEVEQKVTQEATSPADDPITEVSTEANTESGEVAPALEGVLVDGEPLVGEGDPLPDPEEVLKTKTKSNQSND